jgi:hypothetical protein
MENKMSIADIQRTLDGLGWDNCRPADRGTCEFFGASVLPTECVMVAHIPDYGNVTLVVDPHTWTVIRELDC